ncbi:MAG: hypothetical protein ACYTG0_13275 [Planctomycetota bacterium]|jgi:hypothetical protein
MKRAFCFTIAAVSAIGLIVSARPSAAGQADAAAPRVIAVEVLIVDAQGGTKEKHAVAFFGPSDEVAARVDELESTGQIDVLNRLRLTTLENQKALVQVGKTESVPTGRSNLGRGGPPRTSYQHQQVGTLLAVTAQVDGDAIVVGIELEKSQLERRTGKPQPGDEFVPLGIETLTSQAAVRIGSGMTVLVGGLETKADEESSRQLILASARLLDQPSQAKGRTKATAAKQKATRTFRLNGTPAEQAAETIKQILGDRAGEISIGLDPPNLLVVSAEKDHLDTVEALLLSLFASSVQQESPSGEPCQIGGLFQKGQWVTLINDQGGYRIRIMTTEQKARAEKAIAEYEKRRVEFREYLLQSRRRNAEPAKRPPTPAEIPKLAEDLRDGSFLKVVSANRDYVELKGDEVHAIVPLSSIRLILLGDTGDVPGASRARGFSFAGSIPASLRGAQGVSRGSSGDPRQ